MAYEVNTVDEFLKHRATERSAGYLKNWKDKSPPEINTFMTTKRLPIILWQHPFPKAFVRENKETRKGERLVYGGQYNCFSGETRFWANGHLVRFKDVVGETVEVLAGDGTWRSAPVKSFGKQSLRRIVFVPYRVTSNVTFDYEATPDHRWITTTRGEVTDLCVGDRVLATPVSHDAESQLFKDGFVHGLIFGDGSRTSDARGYQIRLCAPKDHVHLQLIQDARFRSNTMYPPSYGGDPVIHVFSETDLKRVPVDASPILYQAGFLAGWMAADGDSKGNHGSPSRRLNSIDEEALSWAEERAPLLGWCVTGKIMTTNMETNFGPRSRPLGVLTLRPEPTEYTVRAIVDEGREDEVYCVVEPNTESFTLEGGLVTGNCREEESVLKRQYHRKDDGTRKVPPVSCPMCRMIELVRDLVEEGHMNWLQPIFKFEGDKESRIVHAGGLFGMFRNDDMSDDEIKEAKAAGINFKEAWMENSYAKCNYVFCVVDADDVQSGLQIATVPSLLGDKVKEVIADRSKSLGSEAGNPWLNPYCIQWEYLKHEAEFQKKYKARVMELTKLTDPIRKLIFGEPPDVSNVVSPFNLETMRAYLERHCLVKLDWDHIFDVPLLEDDKKGTTTNPVAELPGEGEAVAADIPSSTASKAAPPAEEVCTECGLTEATGCQHVACTCGKPIFETDAVCKHCGKVWIASAAPPPAPEPAPKGRKRRGGTETGSKPPFG